MVSGSAVNGVEMTAAGCPHASSAAFMPSSISPSTTNVSMRLPPSGNARATAWTTARAASAVRVRSTTRATAHCEMNAAAARAMCGTRCSPITQTVVPCMASSRTLLAPPNNSRSVIDRSRWRPPEGWNVSPETARSAMKYTVANATSISVGILRRCRIDSTPWRTLSASRVISAGEKNGSGGSSMPSAYGSAR